MHTQKYARAFFCFVFAITAAVAVVVVVVAVVTAIAGELQLFCLSLTWFFSCLVFRSIPNFHRWHFSIA